MPTVNLNKKVFEHLVGKKLHLEQLKDRISMLGTDLEKIEGDTIEVEIFPNRPDLLSEQGFARAFSSFIGVKTGLREYKVKKSGWKVIVDKSVRGVRPFTACAVVKGLRFDEEAIREVIQIQEKLHVTYGRNRKKCAIGVYPVEKITFPVVFKADIPEKIKFRPLETKSEMTGLQILSQHKAGREFGHLLEGLGKFPYFIDGAGKILSMPPIINSHSTGRITSSTKEVFIECSGFDLEVLKVCLNIIVTALADMGGEIYSVELNYGKKEITPDLTPTSMKLNLKYINKLLGLKLSEKEVVGLLGKMGYGFNAGKVLVPAYRADVLHQVDLVEDIAIAYGYENFKEEIPSVATIGVEDKLEKFFVKVREVLIGLGLLEVKNYHLLAKSELENKMGLDDKKDKRGLDDKLITLKNSLGDYNSLRNRLLPSLLKNLSENQHNEYPQNIFEIGRVFKKGTGETGIVEAERLGVVLCHEKVDFTAIRQILDSLMRAMGLEVVVKEGDDASFIKGRFGKVLIGGKIVGMIGEINPSVLGNWELMMPVVSLELDLEELFKIVF